jgi:thiol-disulfide isomerase/thioredoxin
MRTPFRSFGLVARPPHSRRANGGLDLEFLGQPNWPRAVAIFLLIPVAAVGSLSPVALGQPAATDEAAAVAEFPEVPAGATPEQLLDYIDELRTNARPPRAMDERIAYFKALFGRTLAAAEQALATLRPDSPLHEQTSLKKLEALAMLARTGDEAAAAALDAYGKELAQSPSKGLASEASKMLLLVDAQKLLQGDLSLADGVIRKTTALLASDPDDPQAAQLAMQVARSLEHVPGGGEAARAAYAAFIPVFATSGNERIRQLATSLEGVLRRLDLPGNPIEIEGTLLDKSPFNPASLAGKVVLVDFWATWCGPCVAEMPNVLAAYEKYHDRGFEVVGVSLDEDPRAVEDFVEERKIPWPILYGHEIGGWDHPLAKKYGISGIPAVILVGRDGKVVSLNARGEQLGEQLEKLFSDTAKQ